MKYPVPPPAGYRLHTQNHTQWVVRDSCADVIINRLRQAGFLLGRAGPHGNVLKIRPPLVFEQEHADLFLTAFEDAVAGASA